MNDLRDLYQEVILDHSKNPRNYGALEHPDREAEGYNPLCGDQYTIYINTDGTDVTGIRFEGNGCAISKASTSVMTQMVQGKSFDEARSLFDGFIAMVKGEKPADAELGKLAVFEGVRDYPTRTKCATLAWHTMKNAIEGSHEVAQTE